MRFGSSMNICDGPLASWHQQTHRMSASETLQLSLITHFSKATHFVNSYYICHFHLLTLVVIANTTSVDSDLSFPHYHGPCLICCTVGLASYSSHMSKHSPVRLTASVSHSALIARTGGKKYGTFTAYLTNKAMGNQHNLSHQTVTKITQKYLKIIK